MNLIQVVTLLISCNMNRVKQEVGAGIVIKFEDINVSWKTE